jgi:hypothetical protein
MTYTIKQSNYLLNVCSKAWTYTLRKINFTLRTQSNIKTTYRQGRQRNLWSMEYSHWLRDRPNSRSNHVIRANSQKLIISSDLNSRNCHMRSKSCTLCSTLRQRRNHLVSMPEAIHLTIATKPHWTNDQCRVILNKRNNWSKITRTVRFLQHRIKIVNSQLRNPPLPRINKLLRDFTQRGSPNSKSSNKL